MPFKTRYGKHYHMTEGCHGATIPCGTAGLTPCSDCCGAGGSAGGSDGGNNPHVGTGNRSVATTQDFEQVTDGGTASADLTRAKRISQMGADLTAGMPAPDVSIGAGALTVLADDGVGEMTDAGGDDGTSDCPEIEGLDYPDRGQGWELRRRGHDYSLPMGGGGGYESLTRKQAGIVYGAAKRGDVTLDKRHAKEMYDIVGRRWGDLDLHDRSIMLHVNAAVGHIVAGRMALAQAELDGHETEELTRVVGTRKVEVTEDNWIDFAFDLDHDYEVGDIAEEEVTETYWRIKPNRY